MTAMKDGLSLTRRHSAPRRNRELKSCLLVLGFVILLWLTKIHGHFLHSNYQWSSDSARFNRLDLESLLVTIPDPAKAREWSVHYTSSPHVLGQGYEFGSWTEQTWQKFGVATEIKSYPIPIPFTTPVYKRLAILEQTPSDDRVFFEASLTENSTDINPLTDEVVTVPTFLSFSQNYRVSAPVVYVNFGTLEDFNDLARAGVNVTGKVAIIKAGVIHEDTILSLYQQTGIAGWLIYMDPQQDGDITEDNGYRPYPDGPARPPQSVFRQNGPRPYHGQNESNFHSVPTMPISYADAIPILKTLNGHGPNAIDLGKRWEGGRLGYRGVDYNVGPSPANIVVRMENEVEATNATAYNVVGIIKGQIEGEVVIVGNHRDAWGTGAGDPGSGSAALNEMVRSFGLAVKQGWQPLRSLIFISWDGHEAGLWGSTLWVQENLPWLVNQTVAYLEVVSAVSGPQYFARSSPLLVPLMRDIAGQVLSPNQTIPGQTVLDLWGGTVQPQGGSDSTMFIHQCISTANFGFSRSPTDPVYNWHSSFDTIQWMDRFGDPTWKYHITAAQIWGLLAARLVESPVYPFSVTEFALTLQNYLAQVQNKANETNFYLDFDALNAALKQLSHAAVRFDAYASALGKVASEKSDAEPDGMAKWIQDINYKYRMFERQFRYEPGVDKPAYKNIIYEMVSWNAEVGPGFPVLWKSIEAKDFSKAQFTSSLTYNEISPLALWLDDVVLPKNDDYSPISSNGLQSDLHDENYLVYLSRLNNWSSSWPAGSLDASSPHPVLISRMHQEQAKNLHVALNLAIQDIIGRWWTDEDAKFPQRMPLESEEEDLLRWMHVNQHLFRPYSERQGSWRPDFLLEYDETTGAEAFRICEINARFCWNGFMHAAFGQEAFSRFGLEARGLECASDPEEILGGLLELFNHSLPLHLCKGVEHGIDIFMFMEFVEQRVGIVPRLITPDTLRLLPDPTEVTGFKLCCLAQPGATNTVRTQSGEIVEEIHQIGLELHQKEFHAFDQDMKRQISLRCFNDMRTILFAHDKRMLGIVREELGSLLSRKVITLQQAKYLKRGITPTILPGSKDMEKFIASCEVFENSKDGFILKPIRGGKGKGILFGDELDNADWLAKLEPLRSAQMQMHAGQTLYVVQRKIRQPYHDVLLGPRAKPERCHKVGTYHAVNGQFLGLGVWRCSPGRLCAVADGATWISSVVKRG
ncbi:Zn-dependent exopeptidase [Penicillium odoratum]|uniref:Zn-dependent exopeptidase n=1 Tax=Penicillium odoratum TaxID=1167516 RepID=UPI002548AE2B|nr:Zn-dependent exopeptidase [Penicillium odoratum]KAJ5771926.1 Zn-dependent exopeptidase [Penicillium odoratum]